MPVLPTSVALLYARQDAPLGQRMEIGLSALRREGVISLWHVSHVRPGARRDEESEEAITSAALVLLLLSPDLLADEDSLDLAERIVTAGRARLIPVPVRSSNWEAIEILRSLQPLPANGLPLTRWPDPDAGWLEVARAVRRLVSPLMVRVWVEPADSPVQKTRDVQLVPQSLRGGGFRIGERIRVGFQADRDCHVMLVNRGTSGQISRIFPSGLEVTSPCQGDVTYYFPRPGDRFDFLLGGPPGREVIQALACLTPERLSHAELDALWRAPERPGWAEAQCEFDVT